VLCQLAAAGLHHVDFTILITWNNWAYLEDKMKMDLKIGWRNMCWIDMVLDTTKRRWDFVKMVMDDKVFQKSGTFLTE
jgi:hypothetical protein